MECRCALSDEGGLLRCSGCETEYLIAPDGVPVLLTEKDREAFDAGLATDAGRAAGLDLLEDERRFIDLEASSLFLTEEHEIFDL